MRIPASRLLSNCKSSMYVSAHKRTSAGSSNLFSALLAIACSLFMASAAMPQEPAATAPKKIVDFQRDVLPILTTRCKECHTGDGAKNDFQIFDRDTVLGYVDASGSESSTLWNDYLLAPSKKDNPDSLVMPPSGPLSAQELATLKLWLDEGGNWPEGVVIDAAAAPAPAEPEKLTDSERVLTAAGFLHPAIVHFPIALILFSAMAVIVSYLGGGDNAKRVALACLLFGALSAIVSSVAGWGFAMEKGYNDTSLFPSGSMSETASLLYRHRWMGVTTATLSTIVALIAIVASFGKKSGHLWRFGVIGCAIMVSIVGHQGGELVYGDTFHKALGRLGWTTSETESVIPPDPQLGLPDASKVEEKK